MDVAILHVTVTVMHGFPTLFSPVASGKPASELGLSCWCTLYSHVSNMPP